MTTIATIEARTTSTRLPGKVLMDIAGKPMLQHVIERTCRIRDVEAVVVATTVNETDHPIVELAERLGVEAFRGSEDDVLQRVADAAAAHHADVVVKVTGDMPLIDPMLVDAEVAFFRDGGYDYVSEIAMKNSPAWDEEPTFPLGFGAEIVRAAVLARAAAATTDPADREHVSRYIINRPGTFRLGGFHSEGRFAAANRPHVRLAVNTAGDLAATRAIFEALLPINPHFTILDVMALLETRPDIVALNRE